MLAWRTLNRWQRTLAVTLTVFFVTAFLWSGGPGDRSLAGWIRFVGGPAIILGMLLNPASFGVQPGTPGFAGFPFTTKVLLVGGVLAILMGFALGAALGAMGP
jgi:hypothetical protein